MGSLRSVAEKDTMEEIGDPSVVPGMILFFFSFDTMLTNPFGFFSPLGQNYKSRIRFEVNHNLFSLPKIS